MSSRYDRFWRVFDLTLAVLAIAAIAFWAHMIPIMHAKILGRRPPEEVKHEQQSNDAP